MTRDIGEPHDHDHSGSSSGGSTLAPATLDVTKSHDWLGSIYTTEGGVYPATWDGLVDAEAEVATAGAGVVYVPAGVSLDPTSTITPAADVTIRGPAPAQGVNVATIAASGDVQPFALTNPRSGLASLGISGPGAGNSTTPGVTLGGATRLHDCWIYDFATGAEYVSGGGTTLYNNVIRSCDTGFHISGRDGYSTLTHAFRLEIGNCNNQNLLIDNGGNGSNLNGQYFFGGKYQGSGGIGMEFGQGADAVLAYGVHMENNTTADVEFNDNAKRNLVKSSSGPSVNDTSSGSGNVVESMGGKVIHGGYARRGMAPMNLSGITGDFPGQIMHDDGTNTAGSGLPCTWSGSAWQPHDGSATFT